jgi:hypothetical protein
LFRIARQWCQPEQQSTDAPFGVKVADPFVARRFSAAYPIAFFRGRTEINAARAMTTRPARNALENWYISSMTE